MADGSRRTEGEINRGILALLKEIYKPGTKVSAIKVENIENGTKGVAKYVKDSGNVVVYWENGEVTTVEYGEESIRIEIEGNCILESMMALGPCDRKKCGECGWFIKNHNKRMKRIFKGDFRESNNGIKYLSVKVK